jgi:hypothetical protein
MTALVSVETVLLVLLIVLVVGLLRSHAELLRRLGPADRGGDPQATPPGPPAPQREPGAAAPPVTGTTPAGDAVSLSFGDGASALLAFLTTGCTTCAGFWETLGERRLPDGIQTVIVAHGAEREQPARLRRLAPAGVPVVMSSPAWEDYEVPGAPYFVLVDGGIRGEGVATSWHALSSLVGDAIEDQRLGSGSPSGPAPGGPAPGGPAGGRSVDETLAAAGIGPDHPSLYPAGKDRP